MYVAWSVVLFGAVVAAELPRWRYDEKGVAAAERLGLSLALLAELAEQARRGGMLSTAALAAELGVSATDVDDNLGLLAQSRFVAATIEGGWVLARALDGATLLDLYRALKLPLAVRLYETGPYPWQARVGAALQRVASAEVQALNLPLGDLLGLGARPGLAQRR
jgi:membrane protein